MSEALPSIFDVRDGDDRFGEWCVPGTPFTVRTEPEGRFVVLAGGEVDGEVNRRMHGEFDSQPPTAKSMRKMGVRLREVYVVEAVRDAMAPAVNATLEVCRCPPVIDWERAEIGLGQQVLECETCGGVRIAEAPPSAFVSPIVAATVKFAEPAAPTLTVEDVRARVEAIRGAGAGGEDAAAHIKEDELQVDVLRAIADGAPNPAELARAALATTELDFDRWYE